MYISSLPTSKNIKLSLLDFNIEGSDGDVPENNILAILNTHIPLWKTECSNDITEFDTVLNYLISPGYEDLMCRILYECMAKNDVNLNYLSSRVAIKAMFKPKLEIDKTRYLELYNVIHKSNLEYITFIHGNASKCLELLTKHKPLSSLISTIKNSVYTEIRAYKILNIKSQDDCNVVNYVFKNSDMYKLLTCGPDKTEPNKKFTKLRVLSRLTEYLHTNNLFTSNLEIILNNVNTLFKNKNDTLTFLTGVTMCLGNLNILHTEVIRAYEHYYPKELKIVQTLQALGVTDFETVISNVLPSQHLQNIEFAELPEL